MKIGILTFHCAHNYGAVLQCFALQEYLKSIGHDVEIIDYRPTYLLKPYSRFRIGRILSRNPLRLVKNTIRESLMFFSRYKRYKNFNSFIRNRLNLSLSVKNKNIPDKYEAYIIGSDQIWNSRITKGFDDIYFASFPFEKGQRKYVSYAASMEVLELSREQKLYLEKSLVNFDQISVRENNLRDFLQPFTSKEVWQVIDPTLLVCSSSWYDMAISPKIKTKYVLVYQVRVNQRTIETAHEIAKQIGGIVIEAVAWLNWRCLKNKYQTTSPEEFLGLIKHADCVVTTSFHGTAFSVIFNRPFYTLLLDDGKNSRSLSLLNSLGLNERATSIETIPTYSTIDYTEVNQKLDQIRKHSSHFLDLIHA